MSISYSTHHLNQVTIHLLNGNTHYRAGNFEQALKSIDKGLKCVEVHYSLYYNRGIVLGRLGRYKEEIASYDKVIMFVQELPESWKSDRLFLPKAHTNKGIALINLSRYEEAINNFDRALSYSPEFHEAWTNRGIALSKLGEDEKAANSYYDCNK